MIGRGHKTNALACSFLSVLVLAVLAGAGGSSKSASSNRQPEVGRPLAAGRKNVRSVQWVVWRRLGENTFRIGNMFGWCPNPQGRGAPRIVGVRQIDKPDRVTLMAYLTSGNNSDCLGVEAQVERVVHIRGGLRGRPLFDGSQSPPARRWPRPSAD